MPQAAYGSAQRAGRSARSALHFKLAGAAVGKPVIQDLMRGARPRYIGWTMDVAAALVRFSGFFPVERIHADALGRIGKGDEMGTFATRRPVVLVVEDELLPRLNAAETIGDAGFEVVEAANADEAIAVLEARPDIHVVFTDIQMPGSMDGLKLA